MENCLPIDRIAERLDELTAELATGSHARLDERAAALNPAIETLQRLGEEARRDLAPRGSVEQCIELRRRIALIRELLAYAQQVNGVVGGIVSSGPYSARGSAELVSIPRIRAEA